MVMVRALKKCFVNNALRDAGSEFEYAGEINEAVMIALEDEKPAPKPKKAKVAAASKKTFPTPVDPPKSEF